MKEIKKYAALFVAGGVFYYFMEILWHVLRGGRSNPWMILVGGTAFIAIGMINEWIPWDTPFVLQCIIGGALVTVVEFLSGCVMNRWLGLNAWDYSNLPFNLMGQICLPFSLLWCALSAIGIVMDDYMRYWFFGEEEPAYRLI